ncbi:twin-arginine translocation signal domain-containing protein, partial [Actinoplanes sp. NPDC048791]|uniref:twin-arginine translocation signal domain-containing protein n=1 Tax=Actinoplanes sp. NPDC048791 TaxID=3154623 RepID=UPI0033E3425B
MQNESTVSRRHLLGAAAAGAAVVGSSAVLASPAEASKGGRRLARVARVKISVQLNTLRKQLTIYLDASLAELAEIGYT